MYYRGANAALLLYDITNQASFQDVRGWLNGEPRRLRALICQNSHRS
jgi:GTPase SAR1 family protein